ncbi:MAG TPA: ABC transporter ATP-binding protein [Micromonosporaceae bacterium]
MTEQPPRTGAEDGAVAIDVRGLRKAYDGRPAVADLDLTVAAGEIFALLGPNGAGKTTTVEILEGYRRRDHGRVSVLGVDPARADATWRARIGIVSQSTGEFESLRVEEVVRLFAGYYPDPDDPAEVIERVGLTPKRRALTHTLSGGQKRRLDVALGIIGRPELLFLDEPTTGFDPEARREFWDLIRELSGRGTTILLTTHYLDEAEALADRVGVINNGRLVAATTPAELGGRGDQAATVSWLGPDGRREVRTEAPTAFVRELLAEFGDGEVPGLTVTRPSLEDAYLAMIGTTAKATSQ